MAKPKYPPEAIYRATRQILPELPDALRRQVAPLLELGEAGQATHKDLLRLLTAEEPTRSRFRQELTKAEGYLGPKGLEGLPGLPQTTPGQVFICPVPGCTHRYVIAEAGEDPGECPIHHLPLEEE